MVGTMFKIVTRSRSARHGGQHEHHPAGERRVHGNHDRVVPVNAIQHHLPRNCTGEQRSLAVHDALGLAGAAR